RAPIGRGGALGARPVAHCRHHLLERPFQIDRRRPRGDQRGVGALQRFVGGVLAQRQTHAIGRGRADQRRAADHHGADGMRGILQRLKSGRGEAMRQRRLIDHADRPAVRLDPDAAHGLAVDLHEQPFMSMNRSYVAQIARATTLPQSCTTRRRRRMAAIDYEAEYNNRARVPDHSEIFARWARAAEEYRAEALKRGRAELGLSYGDTPRQTIDLLLPEACEAAPLALFIHGGYWRSLDPSSFSHMARGLNGRGVAVAVVGYDLCPIVSVSDIIEQIRRACVFLWLRLGRQLMIYGHSAGGQLAAAMVATDWPTLYPKAPPDLVPAGYAISGVFDLTPLVGLSMN